jgi:hypothetical protein
MGEGMTATLSRHDVPSQYGLGGDAQTREWVSRAWRPDEGAARSRILTHAQNRVAELTGPDAPGRDQGWRPVNSGVASFTMVLLDLLIHTNDLATPQIAPTPEGGLNVEWLVDGDSLSLTADDEGLSIVAERDNGEYAFPPYYWEADHGVDTMNTVIVSAARFLEKISTGIQHRLPITR